jgi:hypothetical protein
VAAATDTLRIPSNETFGGDTSRPVDSLPIEPFFGTQRPAGSSPRPRDSAAAPLARRTRIVVQSTNEATVYVDNRKVAAGAPIDVAPGRNVTIRAAFPDEEPECETALRDSTVRVAEGQTRTISIAVRPCGTLTLDVIPRDALITLQSRVDGTRMQVRADTIRSRSLLLPTGSYILTAVYAGFESYSDTLVTVSNSSQAKLERIRMVAR